jgi:hypothetical protein
LVRHVAKVLGNAIGNSIVDAETNPSSAPIGKAGTAGSSDQNVGNQYTAAGGSPFAQDAPLTSNIDESTFYQPNLEQIAQQSSLPVAC